MKYLIKILLLRLQSILDRSTLTYNSKYDSINQQLQLILKNQYKENYKKEIKIHDNLSDVGFRCYSQFEEDGILLYVLALTGMKTKIVVEIGIGDGTECMSSNLIINHGYQGYLFEGSRQNVKFANKFFTSKKDSNLSPPKIQCSWISAENVNELLAESGVTGEVDLLSIDIDGNDYFIWEAIQEINPRLCVFESHNVIPSNLSLSHPYEKNFLKTNKSSIHYDFRSTSLLAWKKLADLKGYRLIGAHKFGFNVLFLRNDIEEKLFPEVTIDKVHSNSYTKSVQSLRWPKVQSENWIEIK
jgi:hypothetical protein